MPKRRSTRMGHVNVNSEKDIPAFEKLLGSGLTLVLVQAKWCGHCVNFQKNMWNEATQMPNKTMNTASVHYDMVDKTSLANAKIEGYPSLLLVGTDKKPADFVDSVGVQTNAMPQPESKEKLEEILTTPVPTPVQNANSVVPTLVPSAATAAPAAASAAPSANTSAPVALPSPLPAPGNTRPIALPSPTAPRNSYRPAPVDTLEGPPDVLTDLVRTQKLETQSKQLGGGQRAGGLMESLLKITAEAAHAGILLGAASEYAHRRSKTRRSSRKTKKTLRRRKARTA